MASLSDPLDGRKPARRNRPPSPRAIEASQDLDKNYTLGDVFWPANGPNFSALPGIGGMYVKGSS